MPQIASAKKRVRVAARQMGENHLHKTRARTAIKKVRSLIAEGKTSEAAAAFATAQKFLDKAAKTNALHANTVARYKSNLAAQLKSAGHKGAVPAATVATSPKKSAPKKAAAKKSPAKAAAPKATAKKPAAKKASSPAAKSPAKKK